jgi:hypothetical protein
VGKDNGADEGSQKPRADVPLGVAVNDRPPRKPNRAATNDAEDRRRALILIGILIGSVLLLVVLGNTVLRPAIVSQRERMLIDITREQVDELATLSQNFYDREGFVPTVFGDLQDIERLETADGRDLWGNPFAFVAGQADDGTSMIRIRSAGPDGEFETDDDIVTERRLVDETRER